MQDNGQSGVCISQTGPFIWIDLRCTAIHSDALLKKNLSNKVIVNVLSSIPYDRCVVVQAEETLFTAVLIVKMFYLELLKRITKIQSSKSILLLQNPVQSNEWRIKSSEFIKDVIWPHIVHEIGDIRNH